MYNIGYYEKHIVKLNSKAYDIYKKICNILNANHIIFTDVSDLVFDNNIPVFHSYYLRQLHHLTYIVTDKYNLDTLDKIVNARIVVIYDDLIDAHIPDRPNILLYNINSDIHSFIAENLYEI